MFPSLSLPLMLVLSNLMNCIVFFLTIKQIETFYCLNYKNYKYY